MSLKNDILNGKIITHLDLNMKVHVTFFKHIIVFLPIDYHYYKDYKNLPRLCTGTRKSTRVSKICSPRRGLPRHGCCKSLTRGWISLSLYKVVVDHPHATRCVGDIVTMLWFRPSVCVSFRPSFCPSVHGPCEHDRDYTVACFFVKLGRHVNHDERMNPIDFGGQRSRSEWTYMETSILKVLLKATHVPYRPQQILKRHYSYKNRSS